VTKRHPPVRRGATAARSLINQIVLYLLLSCTWTWLNYCPVGKVLTKTIMCSSAGTPITYMKGGKVEVHRAPTSVVKVMGKVVPPPPSSALWVFGTRTHGIRVPPREVQKATIHIFNGASLLRALRAVRHKRHAVCPRVLAVPLQ
jgi:hypothetical protein